MSYYVTTPIFYANGEPHLGHAYSTMAADILARHMRQRGEDVFVLPGTDEHGEPVAQAAEKEGMTPQELVDRSALRFEDMVGKVRALAPYFEDGLHGLKGVKHITDIRNFGLAGALRVAEGLTTLEEVLSATPPLELR